MSNVISYVLNKLSKLTSNIGNLNDLPTTNKDNLVNAIIELNQNGTSGGGGTGGEVNYTPLQVNLPSAGWTGDSAPYSQTVTVENIAQSANPTFSLVDSADDAMKNAFDLITGYDVVENGIKFYASEIPSSDISIKLTNIATSYISYTDNYIYVPVSASGFTLDETLQRYTQVVTVEGMTEGLSGMWNVASSGEILTEAESTIAASISDVKRQDGAIKIYCTELPASDFSLILFGTFAQTTGELTIADLNGLYARIAALEAAMGNVESMQIVNELPADAADNADTIYFVVEEETTTSTEESGTADETEGTESEVTA